jgi:hypothetical protein
MAYTKAPWKLGRAGSVVADIENAPEDTMNGHNDYKYYGGYLICESIATEEDARLISAAPDLLYACKVAIGDIEQALNRLTIKEAIAKAEGK